MNNDQERCVRCGKLNPDLYREVVEAAKEYLTISGFSEFTKKWEAYKRLQAALKKLEETKK